MSDRLSTAMVAVTEIAALRRSLAERPRPRGFVPTMGALHAGHLSLVEAARRECATVVASLFVNPLQFAAGEDLDRYPRDPTGDAEKFARSGVDVLFAPEAAEMYPPGFVTAIDVGALGTRYEGAIRPTHFCGVATVVVKLLHIVEPDVLYLGQKDAQQTAVLRTVVRDLDLPVRVAIVPTVREDDGLAMSSRNVYLNDRERAAAPTLYRALTALRTALEAGMPKAQALAHARAQLDPLLREDYLDVVDELTFEPLESLRPPAFIIGAVRAGGTRLLDNLWIPR
jgi:pantoate--beta-alanine ligase